jgi:membrane-associated protease RseP (regulator of RpoE activity)
MRDGSLLVPAIGVFAVIIGFVVWPFITIFIHELGHTLAARLVGFKPTQLIIGHPDDNDPLFSFRSFGCSVECWPIPFGGATFFMPPPTQGFRTFIIALGGPVFDVLVIVACLFLWQHSFLRLGLVGIIFSQALNALRNLIPVSSHYAGVRVPSDGKVLLDHFKMS